MKTPAVGPPGFVLLEALIALTIVGLAAVASLAAFGAELQAGERALTVLEVDALLQERLSRLRVLPPELLRSLPDSLREGAFPAPYQEYNWEQKSQEDRSRPSLFHLLVSADKRDDRAGGQGAAWRVATQVYRPGVARRAE